MEKKFQLRTVTVEKETQTLTCIWADGFSFSFGLDALRLSCPCVTCRGGHEHMGAPIDPTHFVQPPNQKREVRSIKPMGNYALQITWEDGHNTGLYRFETLRMWADQLLALT